VQNRLLTKKEKEFIIREYTNNKKISEIRKNINRSEYAINHTLKRAGIKLRSAAHERRKHFFNFNYFKKINNEEKAYFLGLMCADGTISADKNNAIISLQECDRDILDKFAKSINYKEKLSYIKREKPRKNMYRLNLGSKDLVKGLESNGCIYKKSKKLIFPNQGQVPLKFMSHFIRGYFDGDGCVAQYENSLIATFTSTKAFILGLKKYFKKIGFTFGYYNEKANAKGTYCLFFRGNISAYKILEHMYKNANVFMLRKKRKYDNLKKELKLKCITV
jgi:intein/homing endonuclease